MKTYESRFWDEIVVDPGSEATLKAYFYEHVDFDDLSMIRIRDAISWKTIELALSRPTH